MSRRSKGKRKGRRQGPYEDHNFSRIGEQRRYGSRIRSPLKQIEQLSFSSWRDDHMPEMLWAALLTAVFRRRDYMACFRTIAKECRGLFATNDSGDKTSGLESDEDVGVDFHVVLDQTKLAEISDEQFYQLISIPLRHPLGYAALRPILLVDALPGVDRWRRLINVDPTDDDWNTLSNAIAGMLDHQSERATDVRWFKVIVPAISGRIVFPDWMPEKAEEILCFPNKGDMREVRPFIRSLEMTLRRNPPSFWIEGFWAELLEKTACMDPSEDKEYLFEHTVIDSKTLFQARLDVTHRFFESMTPERANARLDSVFGMVLYALSIVEEIVLHRLQNRIVGRLALRALVEANITLRYLIAKDNPKLWESYRVYGAGQAKLAFLKAQDLEGDLPPFIDEDALHSIANEDAWQEFLDINVGHWAHSNLRKLSM
jgi:hypothetical protein